jgi:mannose-6-phosphate isomerase
MRADFEEGSPMPATLLATKRVEKPWGRHHLFPGFPDPAPDADPIGEVWFQSPHPDEPDMLIKYLFTSEKLSVQDHPSDEEARKRGLPRGKDECWVILAAEPDSTIALGPLAPMTAEELRTSAEDGTLEGKLDWKPVKAGDFFYSHSGVIHAIGAGLTLIEVQQNSDTTYRLFDYGRPRELHLDDGVAVADLNPWVAPPMPGEVAPGRIILTEGPKFVLERWTGGTRHIALAAGQVGWLVPIRGEGVVGGVAWKAGECVLVDGPEELHASVDSDLLFAYSGKEKIDQD